MQQGNIRPHFFCNPQDAVSGRVDPHIADQYFSIRYKTAHGDKVGGGGNITGNKDIHAAENGLRPYGGSEAFGPDIRAEAFQHQFGVISADGRFFHAGFAIGVKAGKQHCGFYLGGCHGRGVGDTMKRTAGDLQRSTVVIFHTAYGSAHL